ncbi:uncharacterized protein V1510DRAFT_409892 [Dipodascopsis tothii]|uniref:uncharacterized protein n=1 Tax=Dipodascopsis tothii TaxID=44089 RepID=UPI0034D000A3
MVSIANLLSSSDNGQRDGVAIPMYDGDAGEDADGGAGDSGTDEAATPTSMIDDDVKRERKRQAGEDDSPSGSPKPYPCGHDGCKWTFARHSDQRRHLRSHYTPSFHCPYWRTDPTCHRNGGAFNRLDVLKRHLRLVHFVQLKDSDAGWCRICQKMFASSRVFIDHCDKCAEAVQPTEWNKGGDSDEEEEEGRPAKQRRTSTGSVAISARDDSPSPERADDVAAVAAAAALNEALEADAAEDEGSSVSSGSPSAYADANNAFAGLGDGAPAVAAEAKS